MAAGWRHLIDHDARFAELCSLSLPPPLPTPLQIANNTNGQRATLNLGFIMDHRPRTTDHGRRTTDGGHHLGSGVRTRLDSPRLDVVERMRSADGSDDGVRIAAGRPSR